MPRKRASAELSPERKKELRKQRNRERRAERRQSPAVVASGAFADTDDAQRWARIRDRLTAEKILNDSRERPYWLSIPADGTIAPVCGFFPCTYFRRGHRFYYGFLLREHRDAVFRKWGFARKELTGGFDSPLL